MIVLSDGQATAGVRDEPGFRSIAARARDRGTTVTTIGVDVDYNERILAAIAQEANGQHYFVENDAALAKVFEAEAEALVSTVASGTEATIALAPGVELDRVMGRSFRRQGANVVVPLGTFARGEVKTVLMKVKVPAGTVGAVPVANVELAFKDLLKGTDGRCEGKLGLEVVATAAEATPIDAVVATRVERSETAQVLQTANSLFAQGRADEARRKLDEQARRVRGASAANVGNAPAKRAKDVNDDFDKQIAALDEAESGFATPPAATAAPVAGGAPQPAQKAEESRKGKAAGKRSVEQANAFDR
jgi:Ca-activated chloride channel family protein